MNRNRTTATGARVSVGPTAVSMARSLNVVSSTAGASPISGNSQASEVRPTLVRPASTKNTDYLLIGILVALALILSRKA